MARSSYIYLVPNPEYAEADLVPLLNVKDISGVFQAAFTVKWEAFQYCDRRGLLRRLYRFPDGGGDRPNEWIES